MESLDYKIAMLEIISEIKDRATYLKTIDANNKSLYNPDFFNGMAFAYHMTLDGIKTYIEIDEDLNLKDFGLKDYDPAEILSYKPLNHKE